MPGGRKERKTTASISGPTKKEGSDIMFTLAGVFLVQLGPHAIRDQFDIIYVCLPLVCLSISISFLSIFLFVSFSSQVLLCVIQYM